MANATTRVQMGTVKWGDDKIERPLAAAAATYYTGAMIALDASGNAVKCDNTAAIVFDGIIADAGQGIVVDSGGSAGDKTVKVERPFRFSMAIASAAAGDEGAAVYAADDKTVSYSQTNAVHVGWVDRVQSSTSVLVRPVWCPTPQSAPPGVTISKVTQTAVTDTATITIAQLLTGILDGTPTAAATYTLPTAALLVAGMKNPNVGDSFRFLINNKSAGANTITVAGGTGGTADGTLTVAQNVIREFHIIVTNVTASSEAYFVYGIG